MYRGLHISNYLRSLLFKVERGQVYELVITNVSGLYRYRLGDVIKVTGFHEQAPNIQFLYRCVGSEANEIFSSANGCVSSADGGVQTNNYISSR